MDRLLDAICMVDPEGRFVSVSGACERIFGYIPEEIIGKPMIDLVFHEDREKTLQTVEKVVAGHLQRHFEDRSVRKDGQIVHIMWPARWSAASPQLIPSGFAPIALSVQDYSVMRALARGGKRVRAETILRALGDNFFDHDQRHLETQMRRPRRKVDMACLKLPMSTLRGMGSRIYAEIEDCR